MIGVVQVKRYSANEFNSLREKNARCAAARHRNGIGPGGRCSASVMTDYIDGQRLSNAPRTGRGEDQSAVVGRKRRVTRPN